MGLIKSIFRGLSGKLGYRWSLYICRENKTRYYVMHADSAHTILGYVMLQFGDGGQPVDPWELYLNFNKTNTYFKLGPEHFTNSGNDLSPALIAKLEEIGPDSKMGGRGPVFVDVVKKRTLKMNENLSLEDIRERNRSGKPKETTALDIIAMVFGQ